MDNTLERVYGELGRYKPVSWEQIPDLGLYMDQVITFITRAYEPLYGESTKGYLSAPMINNYVKAGLVRRPDKKHYTRNHLAYFIVVTILKRCYSMSQIDTMIQIQTHMYNSTIHTAYDTFINRFEDSLNAVFCADDSEHQPFLPTRDELVLMDHVIQCIVFKIHTEYTLAKRQD